jgi:predicted esterase
MSAPISVKFRIHFCTPFGQRLAIVGNNSTLGNWKPYEGVQMKFGFASYWEADVSLDPSTRVMEYKFVIIDENFNTEFWEKGDNRYYRFTEADNGKTIELFDTWRGDIWGKYYTPAYHVDVPVMGENATGLFYAPYGRPQGCVILATGTSNGINGPSGLYYALAQTLQYQDIAVLQLRYRNPKQISACVNDVKTAIELIHKSCLVTRFSLTGWGLGGAVVLSAASLVPDLVVGIVTLATQSAGVKGIEQLQMPLLFLHGTNDSVVKHRCSQELHSNAVKAKIKEVVLLQNDEHNLPQSYETVLLRLVDFHRTRIIGALSS